MKTHTGEHLDMRLRSEVVQFVGTHTGDNLEAVGRVRQVAIVQEQLACVNMWILQWLRRSAVAKKTSARPSGATREPRDFQEDPMHAACDNKTLINLPCTLSHLVEALNPPCVEGGRAANDTMDVITLLQEELGEVGTVLPGDTSY